MSGRKICLGKIFSRTRKPVETANRPSPGPVTRRRSKLSREIADFVDLTSPSPAKRPRPASNIYNLAASPRKSHTFASFGSQIKTRALSGLHTDSDYYLPATVAMALDFLVCNKDNVQVGNSRFCRGIPDKDMTDLELTFLKGIKPKGTANSLSTALGIVNRYLHSTLNPIITPAVMGLMTRGLAEQTIKSAMSPAAFARFLYVMRMLARIADGNDQRGRDRMLATMFTAGLTSSPYDAERNVVAKLIREFFSVFPDIDLSGETATKEALPPLTPEEEQLIDLALRPGANREKFAAGFRMEITRGDMATLSGLNWLNDNIINFYLELIRERGEASGKPKVHAFNTFFYNKFVQSGYQGVRRWTRNVNIFDKDYLFIPVHVGEAHWCLCVVDVKRKTIKYYDSLGGNGRNVLAKVAQYLVDEMADKQRNKTLDLSNWTKETVKNIPKQTNGSDCGVFISQFADYISLGKALTFTQEDMPYFRRRMVYEILTKQLLMMN